MDAVLEYTVGEMYRLARTYADDTLVFNLTSIPEIFSFVRNVPYVKDRDAAGVSTEVLKRPAVTLQEGGDCDDKAVLAGAFFNRLAVPWRLVTTSYLDSGEMQHVYVSVYDGARGGWTPFDATYARNEYAVERPYTNIQVWRNPDMLTSRLGVLTLEGSMGADPFADALGVFRLSQSPLPNQAAWETWMGGVVGGPGAGPSTPTVVKGGQSLAVAGAVLGSIVPGVGTVAGASIGEFLASLGVTIRGKTGHMSYDEAAQKANEYAKNVVDFVQSLPADGRTFAYQQARIFYANFLRDMGDWWDGAMKNLDAKWRADGGFSSADGELFFSFMIPAYSIFFNADVTTVVNDFYHWYYLQRYVPVFATPLATYLRDKLGEVVNAQPSGTFVVTKPGASPISSSLATGAGGLALLALGLGLVFGVPGLGRRGRRRARRRIRR